MKLNPIEVQKHLKGVDYPADRDDLAATAERNGAPAEIVDALRGMGEEEFSGPDRVMAGLQSSGA